MEYDVRALQVASIPLSVVRRRAKQSELSSVVPAACGVAWNLVRSAGGVGPGRMVAVYLGGNPAGELDLEVGVELKSPVTVGELVVSKTPAGRVATVTHIGSYAGLGAAHSAIRDFCAAHGQEFAGPSWEIYGHWTDDESELRTDVFYSLKV